MTAQSIRCNEFSPIYTNNSNSAATLRLSVTNQCGGAVVLGLYDIGTNTLKDSPQLQPGLNILQVPAKQYLAVYCKSVVHDGAGGCVAEYTVV
ncbi:hypothetical protein [Bradyrhizobium sp. DASA03007]|uniref:hypothetical protein n=1 Tax=unclassified Bradyrhizobium TaxID=2631580 RepID=UPI003F70A5DD